MPHAEQNLLKHGGEAAAASPGPCSSYSAPAVQAVETPAKTDTSRCQGFQATTKRSFFQVGFRLFRDLSLGKYLFRSHFAHNSQVTEMPVHLSLLRALLKVI